MFQSKLVVVVESRLETVPLAGSLVRDFCIGSGASDLESGQIEVCIMEAANNCVVHAYQGEAGHAVEVIVSRDGKDFNFEVRDQGRAMDPGAIQSSRHQLLDVDPGAIEATAESGRGLAIIEAIMNRIEYVSNEGWNRLSMTKRVEFQ